MNSSSTKNIISTFFENNFSKNTQFLFRKWFRLNEYPAEKEEAMYEFWENSPSVITGQTIDDFAKIKAKIQVKHVEQPKHSYSLFQRISSYAAVITLVIATSVYVTYQYMPSPELEYAQVSVSYGEGKKITLADGTVVSLNAGSTLIYPKSFFSVGTRTVFLTGEANFSVAKNPDKPFIVRTKFIDVRALGTKFNVQSYPNGEYTKTTLIEGSVKVNLEEERHKSFILKPNNQLTYSHQDKDVTILDVDAAKIASWEEGYLIFQNVTFNEIAKTLERRYNVNMSYDSHKLNEQSYNVKFNPNEPIEEVMDVLCKLTNNSSYKIEGTTVYFYAK
jgi:ferric-dicitrate binding protein FerR (iron transport regulator)